MITKLVKVHLTEEEIDSPEPIEIILEVHDKEGHIAYVITYPKDGEKSIFLQKELPN